MMALSINYNLILIVFFLINLLQGFLTPISHDEAYYYITYTKAFSFGHFDHPPMVGWLLQLGEFLSRIIAGEVHVGFLRFPFLIISTLSLSVWLNFLQQFEIKIKKIHLLAVTLGFIFLNTSAFLSLPDSPLFFFSILYYYFLHQFLKNSSVKNIILLSVVIVLGLFSKYHFFLNILFSLIFMPSLLQKKETYLVLILSLLGFSPHLIWQWQNNFITFAFHLGGHGGSKIVPFGQFFVELIANVIIFSSFGFTLIYFLAFNHFKKNITNNFILKIIFYSVLAQLIFFSLLSLKFRIEGNWLLNLSICLYTVLLLGFSHFSTLLKRLFLFFLWINFGLVLIFRILLISPWAANYIPRMAELHHWPSLAQDIRQKCESKIMFANGYQMASKLSYYLKEDIWALHLTGRQSEFSFISQKMDNQSFANSSSREICFVTDDGIDNKNLIKNNLGIKYIKIKTIFDGTIVVVPNIDLDTLKDILSQDI